MPNGPRIAVVLLLACFGGAMPAALRAQGGPPMLTDDPGTPGAGKWEINIAALSDHAGATTTWQLPLLDINYGVGDRLQLKFETPWLRLRTRGEPDQSGLGNSRAGVKWRCFDAGEDGWQVSTYPQVEFRFPETDPDLAEPGVSYLLPVEFARKFGPFAVDLEAGRWLRPAAQGDSWIAGVVLGRELREGFHLLAELHDERDVHSARHELTANMGARWEFSGRSTLLAAAGSDLHNGFGAKDSPRLYLGLQLHL